MKNLQFKGPSKLTLLRSSYNKDPVDDRQVEFSDAHINLINAHNTSNDNDKAKESQESNVITDFGVLKTFLFCKFGDSNKVGFVIGLSKLSVLSNTLKAVDGIDELYSSDSFQQYINNIFIAYRYYSSLSRRSFCEYASSQYCLFRHNTKNIIMSCMVGNKLKNGILNAFLDYFCHNLLANFMYLLSQEESVFNIDFVSGKVLKFITEMLRDHNRLHSLAFSMFNINYVVTIGDSDRTLVSVNGGCVGYLIQVTNCANITWSKISSNSENVASRNIDFSKNLMSDGNVSMTNLSDESFGKNIYNCDSLSFESLSSRGTCVSSDVMNVTSSIFVINKNVNVDTYLVLSSLGELWDYLSPVELFELEASTSTIVKLAPITKPKLANLIKSTAQYAIASGNTRVTKTAITFSIMKLFT